MIIDINPDKCHTKKLIKKRERLASRLYWAAAAGHQPTGEDLAKALEFVGKYRRTYGEERRGGKLENACLSIETILAASLSRWITHRDGLCEFAQQQILAMEAA